MTFISCSKSAADDAAVLAAAQAYADAAVANAPAPTVSMATDTTAGILSLANVAETAAGTDTAQALTAGGLAGAFNASTPAGGSAMQQAVVNAVQAAIGSDAGAQTAIANAIVDDIVSTSEFAAAVAAASTQRPVATTVQAQAWTNDTADLTPLRLNEAFKGANQELVQTGFQKLPGGLILQWGSQENVLPNTVTTFTFNEPVLATAIVHVSLVGPATDHAVAHIVSFDNSAIDVVHNGTAGRTLLWSMIGVA